ncbi:MAG TPA: tetratricopeptide repeat protein [Niastella sp.]
MKLIAGIFGLTLISLSACQTNNETNNKKVQPEQVNIIFKDSAGNVLSKDDLANFTGEVKYEGVSNKSIDPKAKSLHEEARKLGQSGNYDLAIAKLEQAIQIQPDWAYPVYDLAFTYLLKQDFDKALDYYKKTDELEPKGFFTAKTALYSLEGEKAGKFPQGLYTVYSQIEWAGDSSRKLQLTKAIIEKTPAFAPAWKELALLSNNKEEKEKAIAQGLSNNPDAETKGILLINKAIILSESGKKEEAITLLGNLIFSKDATTANVEMAKFTLQSITK